MDLKEKVTEALARHLHPERIQLEDDDGISGFVVSTQFRGMSSFDRQTLIHHLLRDTAPKLSKAELRQILAIAALTPVEFELIDQSVERSP
jgi:stress-induced morphogen